MQLPPEEAMKLELEQDTAENEHALATADAELLIAKSERAVASADLVAAVAAAKGLPASPEQDAANRAIRDAAREVIRAQKAVSDAKNRVEELESVGSNFQIIDEMFYFRKPGA